LAAQFQLAQSLHGTPHGTPGQAGQAGQAGQVGFLIEKLLLQGGTVLGHVGADTGLGFGVGGGVGV
jgi:hypothetical protein